MKSYVAHWKPAKGRKMASQDLREQLRDRKSDRKEPVRLLHSPASPMPDDFQREEIYIPAERRVSDLVECYSGVVDLRNGAPALHLENEQHLRHQALRKQPRKIDISAGQKRARQSGDGAEAEKRRKLADWLEAEAFRVSEGEDSDLDYGSENDYEADMQEAAELDRAEAEERAYQKQYARHLAEHAVERVSNRNPEAHADRHGKPAAVKNEEEDKSQHQHEPQPPFGELAPEHDDSYANNDYHADRDCYAQQQPTTWHPP